ncbi:MAG: type IV pilus modification PilV family protein [Gammaproteobacteria bacterium]
MSSCRQQGLTYLEVLVATLVLLIGLVPALDALRNAVSGTAGNEGYVALQHQLEGRLEEMLAEPFFDLNAAAGAPTTASSYSEPGGTPERMLVFIAEYDGDNADTDDDPFTGTDPGLLWIRTAIEGTPYSLETLLAQ